MKKFQIPEYYRSPIISKVKNKRKLEDPRKKDFTPSILDFGLVSFLIPRHFGFCYGVENAIEIAYKAIIENPGKKIYLLSEMIHNPGVNDDLLSYGVSFLQDTSGKQLIPWEDVNAEDIVIIPAFGTTREIEAKIESIGVDVAKYNTTCPFVEKVWNRSEKLGIDKHTIIVHGKAKHEETRATFSRSEKEAPVLILKDLDEAKFLRKVILGEESPAAFYSFFEGKMSANFNAESDLNKIGVVNQTTMLATETQEISQFLRETMLEKYGEANIKEHVADTRDTLCYATNDNQGATVALLDEEADLAIVVGGHNSSNTTHLVELLEQKFRTVFIESEAAILENNLVSSFNIHSKTRENVAFLPKDIESPKIIITSGASCPDAVVDRILQNVMAFYGVKKTIEEVI